MTVLAAPVLDRLDVIGPSSHEVRADAHVVPSWCADLAGVVDALDPGVFADGGHLVFPFDLSSDPGLGLVRPT